MSYTKRLPPGSSVAAAIVRALMLSTSILGLTLSGQALGAEITVVSGSTVGQQTLNPGDTLTVETGGTVEDPQAAVKDVAAGTITIVNRGDIKSTTNQAISVGHSSVDFDNSGTVNSTQDGIYAGSFGTLLNTGDIFGHDNGVFTNHAIFTLTNGGHITSDIYGISAGSIVSGKNSGDIIGGQTGLNVSGAIDVFDNSGTVNGGLGYGILSSTDIGTLTNSGTISGGVSGLQGTISIASLTNTGTIVGASSHGVLSQSISLLNNSNSISGYLDGVHSNTLSELNNSGIIHGGNDGVYAGVGISALTNSGSGAIDGLNAAVNSGGYVNSVVNDGLLSGGNVGVNATGVIGSIVNNKTIAGGLGYGVNGASINALTNSGAISGTLAGVRASSGNIGTLDNAQTGTITGSFAVLGFDDIGFVRNAGRIGGGLAGIAAQNDIASVTNTGTISGSLPNSAGVVAFNGDIGEVINSGTISGGQVGVFATNGDIGVLHNSGTITGDIAAAGSYGHLGELTNSGTMRGGQYGVATRALSALTNSGLIGAADETGIAIVENGVAVDTVLTLNAGSVLIGHVEISGGSDTLHIGNGLNLALTFDTSVPELIETDGNPYVVVGNTVYVADMGAFAAAGVATADLSGSIGDAVAGAVDKGFAEKGADGSGHYWLQGVGGFASETGNGSLATRNRFGGFVAGADFGPDVDSRFGFFAGGARGVIEDNLNSSNADSFYTGIYGAGQFDDFSVKGILRGGYTHAGNARIVANNTVATGLETVSSAQDSYFLSPGITFVKPWVTQDLIVESSLALNYTGIFAGGFSEAGPGGASIGSTSTHVFEAKALLRLPFETVTETGVLTGDVHAGAEGRAIIYPALSGSLAGTPQTFAQASTQASAGVVAGGAVALQLAGGATLFGGIDGTLRSDNSAALSANAGFKAKF
ncbi:MAG TPA: autotransporter outer membrane beta-barrel domain-containing protein [Arsenicitalea sp.]|jgi:hypothetical protein|nr:autotransporter outer membrane beta-barrel domain-containing protein [Arsenicitalea sp.]